MEEFKKEIELDDDNKIIYDNRRAPITIKARNIDHILTLAYGSDYVFSSIILDEDCFDLDDDKKLDELNLYTFGEEHPLYLPLLNLLNGDNEIVIDDDLIGEGLMISCDESSKKKSVRIYSDENGINIKFTNEVDEFAQMSVVTIKNVMFDSRSEIDRNGSDIKKRLFRFYNEAFEIAKNFDNEKVNVKELKM